MKVDAELETRTLEEADLPRVLSLLSSAMAGGPTGERTEDFFSWKHRQNWFGPSPGLVALDGERIVGVRLFLRWRLALGGETLDAVRAVDTATDPAYQRRGIFRRLTLELLERLESTERVDLVFNTPNASSRPGYLKMGWHDVGLLPIHVSPVRPLRFLRRVNRARTANAGGTAAAVAGNVPEESTRPDCALPEASAAFADSRALEELLAQASHDDRVHTPLDLGYLRWRYAAAPGLDYRAILVHRGGALSGVGFARLRTRAGLTELTLDDVVVAAGDRDAASRVLRGARCRGVDHVTAHLAAGSETAACATRALYLPNPSGGIRLFANPRTPRARAVLEQQRWRLSLGDLEVF